MNREKGEKNEKIDKYGRRDGKYVVGVDFGTLSARAVVARVEDGNVAGESEAVYEHGVITGALEDGTTLEKDMALQDPEDYLKALRAAVTGALTAAGARGEDVLAFGFDFTASTVLATDAKAAPLAALPPFRSAPHAMVKLWKSRSATEEAAALTAAASAAGEPWLRQYGGAVSAEWFFPKVAETIKKAPGVYAAAATFMEAADWLTLRLTGNCLRAPSFAGFKAGFTWENGYPSGKVLAAVDPRLGHFADRKMTDEVAPPASVAGSLTVSGAELTGLVPGIPVAIPVIDAHASMPALGLTRPGAAMLILGTSGCFIMHGEGPADVPGTCGFMQDAIIPGLTTFEAGQAAVGDIFDWFVRTQVPEAYYREAGARGVNIHQLLTALASELKPGASGLVGLDWHGGNRSILADSSRRGMITGLSLSTRPEEQYRAWLEAAAFGFRRILEQYEAYGVPVDNICVSGGIALKNPLLVQIYADVTGRVLRVSRSAQSGALGSAVFAAAASGCYRSVHDAAQAMSAPCDVIYSPDPASSAAYGELYKKYCRLHDFFRDF